MAGYVTVTLILRKSESSACVVSLDVGNVVPKPDRMIQIYQPGLIGLGGSMDVVADETRCIRLVHMLIVMSIKSVSFCEQTGPVMASPAQSISAVGLVGAAVILDGIDIVEERGVFRVVSPMTMRAAIGSEIPFVSRV